MRINMTSRTLALLLCGMLVPAFSATAAQAQQKDERAGYHVAATTPIAALTEGEVRKVDRETKKITIKHGPIRNLDMPAMTMVFQVADAAMLDQVRAGDKIRFAAEKPSGAYMVTKIERVK
jgi:Cu/Ag efflux protein CusF